MAAGLWRGGKWKKTKQSRKKVELILISRLCVCASPPLSPFCAAHIYAKLIAQEGEQTISLKSAAASIGRLWGERGGNGNQMSEIHVNMSKLPDYVSSCASHWWTAAFSAPSSVTSTMLPPRGRLIQSWPRPGGASPFQRTMFFPRMCLKFQSPPHSLNFRVTSHIPKSPSGGKSLSAPLRRDCFLFA